MAGIVVPTLFLLVAISVFACFRFFVETPGQLVLGVPVASFERAVMFPMAVVPNLWGVWNMLHFALRTRTRLPLGLHGALLPLLLIPAGVTLAWALDLFVAPIHYAFLVAPLGMAVYYLLWKHVVGFLNHELGIA
jgi:hypothetical protein